MEKLSQEFSGVVNDAAGLEAKFMGRPSRACPNLAHKSIHSIIHCFGLGPGSSSIIKIDDAQSSFSLIPMSNARNRKEITTIWP